MDNKVFFQHPDLMRALCVHETVMQLMVNTLNKAQQQQQATTTGLELSASQERPPSTAGTMGSLTEQTKVRIKVDINFIFLLMLARFVKQ